jgi:hypothetical protein
MGNNLIEIIENVVWLNSWTKKEIWKNFWALFFWSEVKAAVGEINKNLLFFWNWYFSNFDRLKKNEYTILKSRSLTVKNAKKLHCPIVYIETQKNLQTVFIINPFFCLIVLRQLNHPRIFSFWKIWIVVFTSKFSFGSYPEFSGHFDFFFETTNFFIFFLLCCSRICKNFTILKFLTNMRVPRKRCQKNAPFWIFENFFSWQLKQP